MMKPPVESLITKQVSRHICQEVCPWNRRFAEPASEPPYAAGPDGPPLVELMGLCEEEFATRFSGSPIKRAKRRELLRNVAVALGNWGSPEAVPELELASRGRPGEK